MDIYKKQIRQIFLTENTYIEITKYLLNSYHRLVQKKIEYNGSINDLRRLNYYIAEEVNRTGFVGDFFI